MHSIWHCAKNTCWLRSPQICNGKKHVKKMLRSTSAFGCLLLTYWSTKYVCIYDVVTFYPIGLLPTKYIITIIKLQIMAYRSLWENDAKELKFLILSESQVNWNEDIKWQTEEIIAEISYSNLETVRYSPKSEVSQIIRESWQHCCLPNSFSKFFYVVWKKCLIEIFVYVKLVFLVLCWKFLC